MHDAASKTQEVHLNEVVFTGTIELPDAKCGATQETNTTSSWLKESVGRMHKVMITYGK